MILSLDRTRAVWSESNALCTYSLKDRSIKKFGRLDDVALLSVFAGTSDHFATLQRWRDGRIEISVRRHSEPQIAVSTASASLAMVVPGARVEINFSGEHSAWSSVPRAFVIRPIRSKDMRRLLIVRGDEPDNFQEFPWYEADYDVLYQGILGAADLPGRRELLVMIQRDSHPVVYDPMTKRVVRHLTLAGRNGSPRVVLRASVEEFWFGDYDTLVKVDAKTLDRMAYKLVQPGGNGMERLFMGNFHFDAKESKCFAARPFSGDILVLDADSMNPIGRIELRGEPLDIAVLADGTVISREWRTNEVKIRESAML